MLGRLYHSTKPLRLPMKHGFAKSFRYRSLMAKDGSFEETFSLYYDSLNNRRILKYTIEGLPFGIRLNLNNQPVDLSVSSDSFQLNVPFMEMEACVRTLKMYKGELLKDGSYQFELYVLENKEHVTIAKIRYRFIVVEGEEEFEIGIQSTIPIRMFVNNTQGK